MLVFLLALTPFPVATSADEKLVAVYSAVATYTLPVIERGGHEYVGLLELLEPLGRVSAEKKAPAGNSATTPSTASSFPEIRARS